MIDKSAPVSTKYDFLEYLSITNSRREASFGSDAGWKVDPHLKFQESFAI